MKKTMMVSVFAGVALGAVVAIAQQAVYSSNVVGFVTVDVPRGGMIMLRNDFVNPDGGDISPSTLFGDTLPVGTKIQKWETDGTPGYSFSTYSIAFGPPPLFLAETNWTPDTVSLERGGGFWVQIPTNAPDASYTVTVSGEVPDEAEATVPVAEGLNMLAYMFPAEVLWTNTTLAKKAKVGDRVYLWDGSQYNISTYAVTFGPPPAFAPATNWSLPGMKIPVGRSVWYNATEADTWTEASPYTL
ncbi:MAG: hypothetical protein KBA51_01155 [Kiritimatiellae bacterium]|nr:hypothetical protein [Kiritimatiellia bacterium]